MIDATSHRMETDALVERMGTELYIAYYIFYMIHRCTYYPCHRACNTGGMFDLAIGGQLSSGGQALGAARLQEHGEGLMDPAGARKPYEPISDPSVRARSRVTTGDVVRWSVRASWSACPS